jgi:heme o synthase
MHSSEQTFEQPDLGQTGQGSAADYFALLKPRVMSLVVFTAIAGLLAAPGTLHPWLGFVAIVCIAIGAGAAGALNMWYDADIDALMGRTSKRPIPAGTLTGGEALGFALVLAVGSVLVLGLTVSVVSAALLAFTILFYAVIYTMWLKRLTPQNIVIGGAAGAAPPVVAWAAVTGGIDWGAIALFLIIFVWTPPHFWALALFRQTDYGNAGVPMLPNVAGRPATRRQILIYTLLLLPTVALPCLTGTTGYVYAAGSLILTGLFVQRAWAVYTAPDRAAEDKAAGKLFGYSILWLFAIFGLILIEQIIGLPLFAKVL